ncbi:hypothetical protein AAFF_G00222700 [Aldrovandia affinis]|uniref:Uncharacterized protein n=1 Tax=Aldrovandia affinis TaxID=143900 RepID=A0AAD7RG25_9TELE|nr:hypothetical protein AAFF_G00222700 [Aldrovandia affinis]
MGEICLAQRLQPLFLVKAGPAGGGGVALCVYPLPPRWVYNGRYIQRRLPKPASVLVRPPSLPPHVFAVARFPADAFEDTGRPGGVAAGNGGVFDLSLAAALINHTRGPAAFKAPLSDSVYLL